MVAVGAPVDAPDNAPADAPADTSVDTDRKPATPATVNLDRLMSRFASLHTHA